MEKTGNQERLIFLDNIRWVMIILVVLMHINVTYGNMGSWYYVEKAEIDVVSKVLFGIYGSFVQAFFMGFLFLIAGYFVPAAYNRKGFKKFIADRLFRLGIPTLIYMLVINPLILIIMENHGIIDFPQGANLLELYLHYIGSLQFIGESGPLWFALALLIFSVFYALLKLIRNKSTERKNTEIVRLQHKHVILIILIIAAGSFLVRITQPIGSAVLNMQHPFFTQYIVMFILGIYCYKTNLFQTLPSKFGIFWLRAALLAGIPFWALIMVLGGGLEDKVYLFMGGYRWQCAAYALWESFFCLGICLGLLVVFREKFNDHNSLTRFLSDNAFGVYVFHALILVFISLTLKEWRLSPLLKDLVIAILTIPACFISSWLIRRIGIFRRIFS